jgi:hypothetical protein
MGAQHRPNPGSMELVKGRESFTTCKDQLRSFGLMQNWLHDNTTFLDKMFTLQVMALMAKKDP